MRLEASGGKCRLKAELQPMGVPREKAPALLRVLAPQRFVALPVPRDFALSPFRDPLFAFICGPSDLPVPRLPVWETALLLSVLLTVHFLLHRQDFRALRLARPMRPGILRGDFQELRGAG
ncbi:MAG: hypothetical protein ACYC35_19175, partial [Pirellulales bacterium]